VDVDRLDVEPGVTFDLVRDAGLDHRRHLGEVDAVVDDDVELERQSAVGLARLARLHGRSAADSMVKLREDVRYVDALRAIAGLGQESGELPL